MTEAVILAAGNGTRFGNRKQFLKLDGEMVFEKTIDIFRKWVDRIILVMPKDWCEYSFIDKVVQGGATRYDSMCNGFREVNKGSNVFMVDAVRCNTSDRIIQRMIEGLRDYDVLVSCVQTLEGVCYIENGEIKNYWSKHNMYLANTPEIAKYDTMKFLLDKMKPEEGFSVVYKAVQEGLNVGWVQGEPSNIKITYPEDIEILKAIRKYNEKNKSEIKTSMGIY
ncbi:MAG: 2-C-methyl-D-erythritol 4-phosphate cytidylyltransferase [Petrotogales bacterium]